MASRHSTFWSFLLMALISSTAGVSSRRNKDLVAAMEEMQRANYYTYVMLINMATAAAADLLRGNLTFLMPNDRTLAKTAMLPQENAVTDFLLRQSIPSTLLFDDMLHFPTNSMIPTSNYRNNLMLRVSNDGMRRFFLNNIRVISPNICTAGSSIRCHGIDGVVDLGDHHSCSSSTTNDTIITRRPTPDPASEVATTPAVRNIVE